MGCYRDIATVRVYETSLPNCTCGYLEYTSVKCDYLQVLGF